MSSYVPTSVADMLKAFPVQSFLPIDGRPNLNEILRVLKILCRCSRTVKFKLVPLGYLFVALDLANYQWYIAVPLNIPPPTPNAPAFRDAMQAGGREIAPTSVAST